MEERQQGEALEQVEERRQGEALEQVEERRQGEALEQVEEHLQQVEEVDGLPVQEIGYLAGLP